MPRIDLYTAVHKSLRAALFHLAARAGAADFTDDAEAEALEAELATLATRLRAHVRHEDQFIHPVLLARAPELVRGFAEAHAGYSDAVGGVEAAFAAARAARTPDAALAFYRALNRLIAENLAHFDEEERGMTLLWERCTDAELGGIMAAFNASQAPAQALTSLAQMLPALSHPERQGMLRRMRAALPAEAFAAVRAVAARALGEEAHRKLADVLA